MTKTVASLRDLSSGIAPSRDLWPDINARLARGGNGIRSAESQGGPSRKHAFALAAAFCALAVGVWLGRHLLPAESRHSAKPAAGTDIARALQVANVTDPRYLKERATLVASLDERLRMLPPQTQAQVAASLATIRKSMSDIQAALGREPGNALLQELLIDTYQEEMRVLATVNDAGNIREEI